MMMAAAAAAVVVVVVVVLVLVVVVVIIDNINSVIMTMCTTFQNLARQNFISASRITRNFQILHSKRAGILLGDTLADQPLNPSDVSNSQAQAAFGFDCSRGGGLIQRQQRAVTAAETCKLRRQ